MPYKKIKIFLKRIALIELLYSSFANRRLINIYNRSSGKRVLISYITAPFRKNSVSHTNNFEASAIARIFDELGYIVDVMHYEGRVPNLDNYNVIYGFGDVFRRRFEAGYLDKKTIYYGTGMHVNHQNTITLKRIKDVYQKKGVWLTKSSRFVEKTWTHQTSLVDSIIALGNKKCSDTYAANYDGPIYKIDAPYFQTLDPIEVISKRCQSANSSYLWFGSAGLIHKGLDLCLEFFKTRPDLTFHVCGDIYKESDFVEIYKNELFKTPNINIHGFVNIESEKFKLILSKCSFVIFPSCSEGGSPSVITAIGNGALIPIISRETSISTGSQIWIEDFTVEEIARSIDQSQRLSAQQIAELQMLNLNYVQKNHSQDVYFNALKSIVKNVLGE